MASFTSSCLVVQRRCGSWCFQRVLVVASPWVVEFTRRVTASCRDADRHVAVGSSCFFLLLQLHFVPHWSQSNTIAVVYFLVISVDFAQSFLPVSDIVHVSIVSWMFGTDLPTFFFLERDNVVICVRHCLALHFQVLASFLSM